MNEKTKLLKHLTANNISQHSLLCKMIKDKKVETVSAKTIYNCVGGYVSPKLSTMKSIAKVLKVPLDEIF